MKVLAVGAIFLSGVPELGSENITLTTYYPAPSGVYTKMITTGATYLGREAGGFVAVGTPDEPSGSTKLVVMNGRVGIGTTNPAATLEVVGGPILASGGLVIQGVTADPAAPVTGQIWLRTDLP